MRYIFSTLAFAITFSQLSPASLQEVHEADHGTLLRKSQESHRAFLKRDADQGEYILKIQEYLNGETVTFDPDDANFHVICSELKRPGGREKIDSWAKQTLAALKINIDGVKTNLERLEKATTVEDVEQMFNHFVSIRNGYFLSRFQMRLMGGCVPSTKPEDFASLNALSKQSVQLSIDRHALMCEVIKEAYKVLLKQDQDRARVCLDSIDPGTILAKYLKREVKDILDPDSCSSYDGSRPCATPHVQVIDLTDEVQVRLPVLTGNATKDRLRRKLAQKQGLVKSTPNLSAKASSQESKGKGRRPSKNEIALIKEAAAREREALAQRQAEKHARTLAQAAHAQHMKELVRQARLEALSSDSETTLPAPSSALESTTLSKKRVKEKTKGVEDVNKRQRKAGPRASVKNKHKARASSGEKEEPREEETQLAANLYKRLVVFWESKAGQTYHDVALLFRGFGGRVTEKKGGSSHVTLTYYGAGGHKLKHELWRPHGGDDTFGFRTTAALQAFFEKCGLTLH
ncbi:MAG: hypothetical protein C0514_05710 [Candidatus Puniceispirillum sp.]|nr:hypothetical protein [Candidatus Puniceispirillum sp.]